MNYSFDLFGDALVSYINGNRNKFYFEDKKGKKYEQSISSYIDKKRSFTKLERKIIFLSHGKILDIGCGTGSFISALMKRGKVLGIDISSNMIKICKSRGINNVKIKDIFGFKSKNKFDTIVLLDENIGLAGTVKNTKKLLKKLSSLLSSKGQILANVEEVAGNYYIWEARALWNGKYGPWFKWIKFNSSFLIKLCQKQGLKAEVVSKDKKRYIIKIFHA